MAEPSLISEEYTLVVETDKPAAPFAAHLCAYVTGLRGECDRKSVSYSDLFYLQMGISDDETPKGRLADEKNPFYGYVDDRPDENGDYSPWTLWASRTYGTNSAGEYAKLTEKNYDEYNYPAPFGVGIFFSCEPDLYLLEIVKMRAEQFFKEVHPKLAETQARLEGFRLIRTRKYAEELPV